MPDAARSDADRPEEFRRPVLGRLRAALRDPIYSAELRQGTTGAGVFWMIIGVLVVLIPYFWVLLPAVPALVTAEAVLYEAAGGTWHALVMTPLDRERLVWAKLLARIRPLLKASLAFPPVGAAAGAWAAFLFEHETPLRMGAGGVLLGALAGLLLGAVVALVAVSECFTAGSVGILAALRGGTRAGIYLKCVAIMSAIHGVEFALITALWTPLMLATRLFRDPYFVLGAELAGVVVIAAVRVVTVNVMLPYGVLRHAASQLDRWVLYEKRPSEWPERRWSEVAEI